MTPPRLLSLLVVGLCSACGQGTLSPGHRDNPAATSSSDGGGEPDDTTPPGNPAPVDTALSGGPAEGSIQTLGVASFTFTATPPDAVFDCQLDAAPYAACTSPKEYQGLPNGQHTFRVRARAPTGEVDTTPALRQWTVKLPVVSKGIALGVMAGQDQGDGGAWEASTMTAVHAFEAQTSSQVKLVHVFYPLYIDSTCAALPPGPATALREGYTPMLSLSFTNYGGTSTGFDYAALLAGSFDPCFRSFARQAKGLNGPLILRMFWEMNGSWFTWGIRVGTNTPKRHVDAFKRIVNIFREEGAANVKFAWCPNNRHGEADAYASYYPSDAYVDYLCLDGYNWGTAQSKPWQSFDALYAPSYAEITALSPTRPLIIGEYASHTAPGDKAAWIAGMRTVLKTAKYSRVKVLTWFNKNQDGAIWEVASPAAALTSYKALAADPYFQWDVP